MKEKNVGVIRLSRKRQKHFRSLAPANDIQGVRSYIEWLDEIINDETFGSIAMTGDLGIGKSSVVRTFERTKRYKFIYLSASDLGYRFDENKPDAKAEDAKEKDARQARNAKIQTELEKDLLVQLIALCRRSDIPKSRFRLVPENGAPFLLKAYSFLCGAAALCGGMLAINMLTEQTVYPGTLSMWPWISLAVFASLSVWFWSNRLFQNYRLSKLSFGTDKTYSASAEINPNALEPESLNTDLHEILYLFERLAKKKHLFKKRRAVFIIEDLDRYPSDICIPILTKLRQINSMLNSRYRNQHRGYGLHYKFVYLLNDRIFDASESSKTISEKDPYKFFDVIIPVLPKLGFTNSSEIIRKHFGTDIEQSFIDEICCYVYDYRKLTDIENEFSVYQDRFKDDKNIFPTNLLAFVIYKVFFKKKYDQLHKADAREGAPVSELLKSLLMPNAYPDEMRAVEPLERILENRFKDKLFDILQMTDAVKNKYKSEIVATDEQADFALENLSGVNLSGEDLQERDFSHNIMHKAIFDKANLKNAIFNKTVLTQARFINATLTLAKFEGAIMQHADFSHSVLLHADCSRAILPNATIEQARMSFINLHKADLSNASLWDSHLFKADLSEAILTESDLSETYLYKSNLTHAQLGWANLKNANLSLAQVEDANFEGANLIGANLLGIDNFEKANWRGAKYCNNPDPIFKTKLPFKLQPDKLGMIEVDKDGFPVSSLKK